MNTVLPTVSPRVKQFSHKNKGNDHNLKKLLIIGQILLKSTLKFMENSMEDMHTDV